MMMSRDKIEDKLEELIAASRLNELLNKKEAEEEKKAAGLVKVKAKRRFLDKELNQIKDAGDAYTVSRERAAVLVNAGVAEETE